MHVSPIDLLLIALYGAFVLGIGFAVRRRISGSGDFLLAGRSIPAWVAGLAFLSANLGAQEMIGMAASGAKYGIMTSHFYWVGAVPAMLFVGVFMMPFYYGSRARSVPEYLKLRFDEKTRAFNALTFAVMTVFSSGISMYAMGALLSLLLGWNIHASIVISAVVVLRLHLARRPDERDLQRGAPVLHDRLRVRAAGLPRAARGRRLGGPARARAGDVRALLDQPRIAPSANPMGVEWFGLVMGLGFVLSFGYWCTDFLVVQRAMAADSMNAARRTPVIAALPKMIFPFLVIVPGIIALGLTLHPVNGTAPRAAARLPRGGYDYNMALPMMMARYYPEGHARPRTDRADGELHVRHGGQRHRLQHRLDLRPLPVATSCRAASDAHYLNVGRATTVVGTLLSVAAAYLAMRFNNIMDMLQLIFSFVNAPLFATFLLGMFWQRTTGHGAFWGLVAGTLAATLHYEVTAVVGGGSLIPKLARRARVRVRHGAELLGRHLGLDGVLRRDDCDQRGDGARSPPSELKGLVYGLTPHAVGRRAALAPSSRARSPSSSSSCWPAST